MRNMSYFRDKFIYKKDQSNVGKLKKNIEKEKQLIKSHILNTGDKLILKVPLEKYKMETIDKITKYIEKYIADEEKTVINIPHDWEIETIQISK